MGVLGTLVWDRIVPEDDGPVVEVWGGIGYTLASVAASLDPGWTVLPIIKIGADLASEARRFLAGIPGIDGAALRTVVEPNNRVELCYHDDADRTETLTGGVAPWHWSELEPAVARCDAMLVNFISGHELSLETTRRLRAAFAGPTFADLHSLFLATGEDGERFAQGLVDVPRWLSCFDVVQLNRDEAALASPAHTSPWEFTRWAVASGPRVVAVTLGADGATWAERQKDRDGARTVAGTVTIESPRRGDPTGCGDVWGGAFFSRLLSGDPVDVAAYFATRLASRKLDHRGAEGLLDLLRGEVST